jgi:hypothetical protein
VLIDVFANKLTAVYRVSELNHVDRMAGVAVTAVMLPLMLISIFDRNIGYPYSFFVFFHSPSRQILG